MAKEKAYLETSVISYLTARPSRDVVKLAKQQLTREWWETSRSSFELCVSPAVIREIYVGDADAAERRAKTVSGLTVLAATDDVAALFRLFLDDKIVPAKAATDALHIAFAAVHGMSYLLTWNCKHINNAALKKRIDAIISRAGYNEVIMATPEELMR